MQPLGHCKYIQTSLIHPPSAHPLYTLPVISISLHLTASFSPHTRDTDIASQSPSSSAFLRHNRLYREEHLQEQRRAKDDSSALRALLIRKRSTIAPRDDHYCSERGAIVLAPATTIGQHYRPIVVRISSNQERRYKFSGHCGEKGDYYLITSCIFALRNNFSSTLHG